jgi:GAF domain-containing protein
VLIVGAFALVDFFFSHALDQKSAGLVADIGLALVLGFSFNSLHRQVDSFVDRMLFRKRHRAEEHIAGVADAMAYARTEELVRSMLTEEPLRAFDLTGARMLSALQETPQLQTLCAYVEAQHGAVRLTDGEWNFDAAAAVPVFSHGALDALVLYGLHRNGTDLDAEELVLLERLCAGAGSALDRLEAETLRHEVLTLRQALQNSGAIPT